MKNVVIVSGMVLFALGMMAGCGKKKLEGEAAEKVFRKLEPAIEAGNIDRIRSLMKKNPGIINARDINGCTLVHKAIKEGERNEQEVVKLFISKGADVNTKDLDGQTPLHYCAKGTPYYGSSIEMGALAELLIEKGADINARDNEGRTPLILAKSAWNSVVENVLSRHGAKE